jgi:hypothetical protein
MSLKGRVYSDFDTGNVKASGLPAHLERNQPCTLRFDYIRTFRTQWLDEMDYESTGIPGGSGYIKP